MTKSGPNKKAANSLVSASCAAVLAVYVTGYVRTQSAANRFAAQIAERRVAAPDPQRTASPIAESLPAAPNASVAAPAASPAISSRPTRDAAAHRNQIASAEPIPARDSALGGAAGASPAEVPAPQSTAAGVALPEAVQ